MRRKFFLINITNKHVNNTSTLYDDERFEGRHRLSDENEVNSLNHDQGGNFVISGGVSRGTAAGGNILLKIPTQS